MVSPFNYSKSTQTHPYFSPEQFKFKFEDIIEKYQKKEKSDKIIIIIDNIDRCPAEHAYQLLSDVKSFLDVKNVTFLIPVDDTALTEQISQRGDKPSEFLRKIFNAVLYVKPLKATELFAFTSSLSKKEGLDLETDTIYILSEAYATNPRRIIQLLNNLQIEFEFFDSLPENTSGIYEAIPFSKKHEKAICKLLVIREEWPEFYFEIAHKPELLRRKVNPVNRHHSVEVEREFEKERRKDPKERMLIEFLNNTKSITEAEDDSLIYRLMTLKDPFSEIPEDVLNDLSQDIYDKHVFSYIKGNEHNFTLLIMLLISELETEIRKSRQLSGLLGHVTIGSESDIAKNFDHLLGINALKGISIEKFDKKIESCVSDCLHSFITELKELKSLVKYTHDLEKRSNSYLYDFIVRILNNQWPGDSIKGTFYVDLFSIFVNEYPDKKICKDLQDGFIKRYKDIIGYDYLPESKVNDVERLNLLILDGALENVLGFLRNILDFQLLKASLRQNLSEQDPEFFSPNSKIESQKLLETWKNALKNV